MKSALSLTLMVSLVASTLPVTAQERTEKAGPLARAPSDWSRALNVAPGTEIVVTVRGSQPGTRYVVRADESGLTVLNLTDPTLPAVAKDRKVADLGQIVEYIARDDIAEIKTPRSELRGFRERYPAAVILPRSDWHVFVGVLAGSLAGGMIGGVVDCRVSSCGPGGHQIPTGVFVGALAGAIVGGVVGHRWRRAPSHKTDEEVIHRAP